MENAKNVDNQSQKNAWKFIQPLQTAWNANRPTWGSLTVFLIITVDQLVKYWAINKNLPDWKVFLTTCNPDLSLSININHFLFVAGWTIALLGLFFLLYKFKSFFLVLVLAGALSNLIDRLVLGCVIDYISIWKFPIFNLADFFISFGFIAFFFQLNVLQRKKA